jgi:hypothetical protein
VLVILALSLVNLLKRSRRRREQNEANIEYLDAEYQDIDGDGTLDWHPAVGSYVCINS